MADKEIIPDRPGQDDPGRGRRLGLDVGTVRIGIAVSDPDCILATPERTVQAVTKRKGPDREDIDEILDIIAHYGVVEIVIGLPRMLDGSAGSSVKKARDLGFRINRRLAKGDRDDLHPVPIRYVDERMTTVMAHNALREVGIASRESRSYIDQAAAVNILQSWLDQRRAFFDQKNNNLAQ